MKNTLFGNKNKKANAVIDTITALVMVFVFVVVMIIGYKVFTDLKPGIQEATEVGSVSYNIIENNYDRYPKVFDNLALFVFIALWLMALIASFMIDSHPIFFGITIILLINVFISSIYLSNYYATLVSSEMLSSAAAQFVKTNFIMQHLLEETIMVGFSIAFVLYAKQR